eukprot:COSAG06_NODE_4753_length_3983_cov_8.210681_4_plen_73_part_00
MFRCDRTVGVVVFLWLTFTLLAAAGAGLLYHGVDTPAQELNFADRWTLEILPERGESLIRSSEKGGIVRNCN